MKKQIMYTFKHLIFLPTYYICFASKWHSMTHKEMTYASKNYSKAHQTFRESRLILSQRGCEKFNSLIFISHTLFNCFSRSNSISERVRERERKRERERFICHYKATTYAYTIITYINCKAPPFGCNIKLIHRNKKG